MNFTGESASADREAAEKFSPELKKLIAEKGYVPDQIFNADETGLFWKRMPSRTWISKEERRAPGFKVAKDRFTLLLCANASGSFRCKPMLVYRSENPRALKNKNRRHLPVYWKANKTAWVTQANFGEWFAESFIPEVKNFLTSKNLAFKVLLLLDNCRSHSETLSDVDPNVEILFFPPNTTALIQPMDQTVIATFKSYYLRRLMAKMVQQVNHHRSCDDFNAMNVVKSFWRGFTIMDAITLIDESWKEVKDSTLNACWTKLYPEIVPPKEKFLRQECEEIVQEIVNSARTIEGEGFQDLQDSEVLELISTSAELSAEEVEEIATPLPPEKPMSADTTVSDFDGKAILQIINSLQNAVELSMNRDPIMIRSLNFKHLCDKAMEIYEELYKDVLRRAKQTRLPDFFVRKN